MATEEQRSAANGGPREDGGESNKEELAYQVRGAGEATLSQAQNQAAAGKDRAAEGVDHASGAMHRAAENLREQEPWLADLIERGAGQLAQFGETLRSNDLRGILQQTEELSRRQPMLVAGAAFAAGFAAMRAVRSGVSSGSATLAEVADDAMTTAQREARHAMAGAQHTAEEIGRTQPEPQRSGGWGNGDTGARSADREY